MKDGYAYLGITVLFYYYQQIVIASVAKQSPTCLQQKIFICCLGNRQKIQVFVMALL